MKKYPISIIIPVYKNYEMFFKYFELNKKYFENCEVIIMNDYPQKNITKSVKKIFADAVIINNKKNLGFASNVNRGILKSTRDYVFLMNSDVVLKDNSYLNSLKYFKHDKNLFAVGFAQVEENGKIVGSNRAFFEKGLINHSHQLITNHKSLTSNFWAEGGSSIFKKSIFIKLGLLNDLYNPFYWEDIDLSYRAWKAGYKILFDQNIQVEHHHESTIGKYFSKSKITKTAFRNQLIFHWKNLTDKDLINKHLINIPRFIFFPGFFEALIRLPKILQARKKAVRLFVKTDKEIMDLF